jgi:hypothetical protein
MIYQVKNTKLLDMFRYILEWRLHKYRKLYEQSLFKISNRFDFEGLQGSIMGL